MYSKCFLKSYEILFFLTWMILNKQTYRRWPLWHEITEEYIFYQRDICCCITAVEK